MCSHILKERSEHELERAIWPFMWSLVKQQCIADADVDCMLQVEEPTVRMTFLVNTSAFAGKEGKFVTSRNLKERLERELERNLALRVEPGESADQFIVSGRGSLHISILMENMRREGYEFAVGPPTVSDLPLQHPFCMVQAVAASCCSSVHGAACHASIRFAFAESPKSLARHVIIILCLTDSFYGKACGVAERSSSMLSAASVAQHGLAHYQHDHSEGCSLTIVARACR